MVTIPELVGKKTKEKTRAGRNVYITPKREYVSEKGISIPLNKKKTRWLNAPSIYHGVQYTEDEVKRFYEQGQLKPSEIKIIKGDYKDAKKASEDRSRKLRIHKKRKGGPVGVGSSLRGFGKVRNK